MFDEKMNEIMSLKEQLDSESTRWNELTDRWSEEQAKWWQLNFEEIQKVCAKLEEEEEKVT